MSVSIRRERARQLQGSRAGFISRAAAGVVDAAVFAVLVTSLLALAALIRFLIFPGRGFGVPRPPEWVTIALGLGLAVWYLAFFWSSTGRTPGNQLVGLRVVPVSGRRLRAGRATARALAYVVFPAGLLWSIVSSRNASLQDLLLRTAVVYDWRYRPAIEEDKP